MHLKITVKCDIYNFAEIKLSVIVLSDISRQFYYFLHNAANDFFYVATPW